MIGTGDQMFRNLALIWGAAIVLLAAIFFALRKKPGSAG